MLLVVLPVRFDVPEVVKMAKMTITLVVFKKIKFIRTIPQEQTGVRI